MVDLLLISSAGMVKSRTVAACPQDHAVDERLSILLARICAARILREHHVWEAARLLRDLLAVSVDLRHSREFRALMDRDALADAVDFMAKVSRPARSFTAIAQKAGRWNCMLRYRRAAAGDRQRMIRSAHADLAAAMLAALLRSAGDGEATAAKSRGSTCGDTGRVLRHV